MGTKKVPAPPRSRVRVPSLPLPRAAARQAVDLRRASLARMGIEYLEAGIRDLFAQLEAQESQRQQIEASIAQTDRHIVDQRAQAEAMPYSSRAREERLSFLVQAETIAVTSRQVLATQHNIADLAQLIAGLTREVARIKEQFEPS